MAEKETYPTIPAKPWWLLRNKFKQSIPSTVTIGYLAAVLGITEDSARANVYSALIAFNIIDTDGKPTERAKLWRDDEQYPSICEQIREEIYPTELLHALPPPTPDRDSVKRWIANRTGLGESAANKMVSVYLLLCEANPQAGQDVIVTSTDKKPKKPIKLKSSSSLQTSNGDATVHRDSNIPTQNSHAIMAQSIPSIHIDIQIHISSDSSNSQIDQIFSSMANHLGKLINKSNE